MAENGDIENDVEKQNDNWIEMERKPSITDPKHSRFQVAKVDFASDTPKYKYANNSDEAERQPLTDMSNNVDCDRSYDTHNVRSLRHYTREALPRADHYRNVMSVHGQLNRPTLDELLDPSVTMSPDHKYSKRAKHDEVRVNAAGVVKLGWIQGVFVRCLLNIWGVMLFLRLSWVIGQAGIGLGSLVILLATTVTVLTSLSMSAICTNGEVKGGGTYYMISRSLGPEFGGAIGLIFSLANAVAVAMYVVGFSETVVQLMEATGHHTIVDGGMHDVRIIGCITVFILFCICLIGTSWESKTQMVLLAILLISMADFVIGSFIPPSDFQKSRGFVGWDLELMKENFGPAFRDGATFISVFSVYFPAATGILAGANISGDLADPQVAIPKGTFLAILVSTLSYLWFGFTAGSVVLRDAVGNITIAANFTNLLSDCSSEPGEVCKYGLMNYYEVMETVSAFGPIIYAGIFAATLSSALASLVSAPKVFQALCKDRLFPHIHFFAKGFGRNNEPIRGYCLAFVIALACVAIGDLNAIAPIISNFFLAAYCLINFSCFHASFARSPGFRPSFKYYNLWLSLLGAILCLSVMFIMNWWAALVTFALVLGLYIYIYYRKPDVNWGSSTQAQTYKTALSAAYRLNNVPDHVKNFRPQILVLTGTPGSRLPLVDFANHITKKIGLLVCGHIVKESLTQRVRYSYLRRAEIFLQKRKIKAFYTLLENESFSEGARCLMQCVGVGKLRPNIVFMGYKSNWQESTIEEIQEYFNVILEAFDKHLALGILRLQEGLDYSEYNDMDEVPEPISNGKRSRGPSLLKPDQQSDGIPRNPSSAQLSQAGSSRDSSPPSTPAVERKASTDENNQQSSTQVVRGLSKAIPKDILTSVNKFQRKQKKGTIDVWWLYDDGGLTMLIPYLLTTHSQWSHCRLRVFSLANKKDELEREQRSMAALLNKFRIDYSDVKVIPDITKPPQECSKQDFENIIAKWREDEDSEVENSNLITKTEMLALKDKNNRHIRLRELLLENSQDASLIVMTLPMPRKGTCSAPMYLAWLETLTRDMPPFLLIRGNQTSVLTFYS
ncbi:solute carrier family 12 member 3-like [Argiope bruennichi]|uniref:solute carrier family 12 member 3-like n=1 Tax=Argiope bruennichi TaxID=94029 RepID=UPI00249516E7|nr:solute carrier family 12 member 3-like [Argiope bruennichi]